MCTNGVMQELCIFIQRPVSYMNKGPSDEVIHTQRESRVGQWGRRVVFVVLSRDERGSGYKLVFM